MFSPAYLSKAAPRTLVANDSRKPALVFVDGAEEDDGVGIGAVLFDGNVREAFGGKVPTKQVQGWKLEGGRGKVIHQAELLPAAVAATLWSERLRSRRWVLFVDNDGARGALIKGSTTSRPSASIVQEFWLEVAAQASFPWVERVPTNSNPADGPSRGDWALLSRLGVRELKLDWLGRL